MQARQPHPLGAGGGSVVRETKGGPEITRRYAGLPEAAGGPSWVVQRKVVSLLRQGKPEQAGSLFVQRALGEDTTPESCASLLQAMAMGPDVRRRLAQQIGGAGYVPPQGGHDAHYAEPIVERFLQTLGREGAALLSSQAKDRTRDQARAVLGVAYDGLADRLAPAQGMSWLKDVALRPWYEAMVGSLPECLPLSVKRGDSADVVHLSPPWTLRDPAPLMTLAQHLGIRSLTYPLMQAGLMTHAPKEYLADPAAASRAGTSRYVPHPQACAALLQYLGLRLPVMTEDHGVHHGLTLAKAGLDAAKAMGAPVMYAPDACRSTRYLTQALGSATFAGILFGKELPRVFSGLEGDRLQGPLYSRPDWFRALVVPAHRRGADDRDLRNERGIKELINSSKAWVANAMPELRAEDFIKEREALVKLLRSAPAAPSFPMALVAGDRDRPLEGAALAEATETVLESRRLALMTLYCGYLGELEPVLRSLKEIRAPGSPSWLRQIGEPLLVPRLASHLGLVRNEVRWLESYALSDPPEPDDVAAAMSVLGQFEARAAEAIGDLRRWPEWVAQSAGTPSPTAAQTLEAMLRRLAG